MLEEVKASVLMDKNKTLALPTGKYKIVNDIGNRGLGLSHGMLIIKDGEAYFRIKEDLSRIELFIKTHLKLLIADGVELGTVYAYGNELSILSNGECYIDRLMTNSTIDIDGEVFIDTIVVCQNPNDILEVYLGDGRVAKIECVDSLVVFNKLRFITTMNIANEVRQVMADRLRPVTNNIAACQIGAVNSNGEVTFNVMLNGDTIAIIESNSDIYEAVLRKYKEVEDRKIRQNGVKLTRRTV